jgi:transposase-like protein
MPKKKSSSNRLPRFPLPCEGLQVNFCKQPACQNFGVLPIIPDSKVSAARNIDLYRKVSVAKNEPSIQCKVCNFVPGLKSNVGIISEYKRVSNYLQPPKEPSCTNQECDNKNIGVTSFKKYYYTKGVTSYGAQRYQCKLCKKTFSINKNPLKKQKKSHLNLQIFLNMMNGMPLRRVCKTTRIKFPALYGKIDFFHRQALGYMGKREAKFFSSFSPERIYISTDRQRHTVNWTESNDKRNTQLEVIASADQDTGFLFALNINFDPFKDPAVAEDIALKNDEYSKPKAFRDQGHLWLRG